jgi:crotonobetainyl-CoA:carnitine CoA-transferase CaiB-like acyl-CoA transferase
LKVLELSTVLAGPAVGQFFAELGAQVIKVEPPSGDVTRSWRVAHEQPQNGLSAYYVSVNWGKEVWFVNLSNPEDLKRVKQAATVADVVITNQKPASLEKYGLDYATLSAHNPTLVYALLTGYGTPNPRLGYDAVVQAESGFMDLNGQPDGPPTKMPVALMDLLAAHQMKEGVLVALLRRERTGKGGLVEVSLMDAGIASLANQASTFLNTGAVPKRLGSDHPQIAPYGTVFYDAEGLPFILAVGSDAQFAALCTLLGRPGWAQQPEYATNPARVNHRKRLTQDLQTAFSAWQRNELLRQLEAAGVPAGAVQNLAEVAQTPNAKALELNAANGLKGYRTAVFGPGSEWWAPYLAAPAPLVP